MVVNWLSNLESLLQAAHQQVLRRLQLESDTTSGNYILHSKKVMLDPLILILFPNNIGNRTTISNKMPVVKITTGRWV